MPYGDWRGNWLKSFEYGQYVKLHKYANDIKGYYPYMKTLKKDVFRFKERDMTHALEIFKTLNHKTHTMVSVHVRLTDYITHLAKLYKIPTYLTDDYLRKAMEYFVHKYNVSIFDD